MEADAGKKPRKAPRHPKPFTGQDLVQAERFNTSLRSALAVTGLSHRTLSERLGITVGSFSKYLRLEVHPFDVAFEVQFNLASCLGMSVDELLAYYETGEHNVTMSFDKVNHWLRESVSAEDVPLLMESLGFATRRITGEAMPEQKQERYTWPIEVLEASPLSQTRKESMGLTHDRLEALATDGVFDDDLVWAFSVACDIVDEAVREAFTKRQPVPERVGG